MNKPMGRPAHKVLQDTELLPTQEFISFRLQCKMSGVTIGVIEFLVTAGTSSYLSHWNDLVAMHPVFSFPFQKLLKFTRDEWDRLAQRVEEDSASDAEVQILQLCFLALMHSLDSVKQDAPALPPIHLVVSHLRDLLALAGWKFYLESQRFRFPTFHISKINTNQSFENVGAYIQTCFDVRRDYETKKHDAIEKAKIKAAADAAQALASNWVTPISNRILWAWVQANLPEKWQPDAMGWMGTIFMGKKTAIIGFDKDEIELMEEIIVAECPSGTGVMHAVRTRLDQIWSIWKAHYEDYEVDLSDFAPGAGILVNGQRVEPPDPGDEPKMEAFDKKWKFFVAHGAWKVAKAAWDKYWAMKTKEAVQKDDPLLEALKAAEKKAEQDREVNEEDI